MPGQNEKRRSPRHAGPGGAHSESGRGDSVAHYQMDTNEEATALIVPAHARTRGERRTATPVAP